MDRERTLKKLAEGREAWNKWAKELLAKKYRLQKANQWHLAGSIGHDLPLNEPTKLWWEEATANFSNNDKPQTFKNNVDFTNLIFPGPVLFEKATFRGKVTFKDNQFFETVSFKNAHFKSQTSFGTDTVFEKDANFSKTKFEKQTKFTGVRFKQNTNFSDADFNNEISFQAIDFYKVSNFRNTNFCGRLEFQNTKFSYKAADIKNNGSSKFITDFTNSNFHSTVTIYNVDFYGTSIFRNSNFKKTVFLIEPKFHYRFDITTSVFEGAAIFSKTIFEDEAIFNAIRSESAFDLAETNFLKKLPDFIQAHFEEAPRLDNINFPPSQIKNTNRDPEDEAKYRALKRLAIQAHDHENEQKFWAGEIRARRHIKDFPYPWQNGLASTAQFWVGVFYGLLSDYGRSIWRPLLTWTAVVLLMMCIHLLAHHSVDQTATSENPRIKHTLQTKSDCNTTWAAFHVSLKTSSLGLGFDRTKSDIYKDHYRCLYPSEKGSLNIPNCILIYEFLQLLGSAILIFLALLGIRNNFKLK